MTNNTEKKDKLNSFSVGLGLLDYINPIFYTITTFTIARNMFGKMNLPIFILYCLGALCSLVAGFTIPTVKVLVGLGKFEFKMPVNLVFYTNAGILLSGLMLFGHVLNVKPLIMLCILALVVLGLFAILKKGGKFNTVAVLCGAAGYLMFYICMIIMNVINANIVPVCLFAAAICLFVFLVLIGIKSNLMNPKVHWVIEASNVICQFLVALGTILSFVR